MVIHKFSAPYSFYNPRKQEHKSCGSVHRQSLEEMKTKDTGSPVKKKTKSLLFCLEERAVSDRGVGGNIGEVKAAEE